MTSVDRTTLSVFWLGTLWLLACPALVAEPAPAAETAETAEENAAAGVAATPEQCLTARTAHERLLESSFEVQREFRMSVNGNLKKRELARLDYSDGTLEVEVLEDEVLSKIFIFDGEGEDFALELEFDCQRLAVLENGHYELGSEDGLEVADFEVDPDTGTLRPVAWRLDTTERLLFKKFVMEGRAEYSDFSWRTSGE